MLSNWWCSKGRFSGITQPPNYCSSTPSKLQSEVYLPGSNGEKEKIIEQKPDELPATLGLLHDSIQKKLSRPQEVRLGVEVANFSPPVFRVRFCCCRVNMNLKPLQPFRILFLAHTFVNLVAEPPIGSNRMIEVMSILISREAICYTIDFLRQCKKNRRCTKSLSFRVQFQETSPSLL